MKKKIESLLQEMIKRRNAKSSYAILPYKKQGIEEGRKFFKIIINDSAEAFVDKKTGEIFMAASWSKPAKWARGNVNSDQNGFECMDCFGYVKYLK